MAPQPPRMLGRITKKSPTEFSRYKLVRRPPRKLATEKCDNCRQGKLKCVPQGRGCQRCFQKGLKCPGPTKVKRTKPRSPVSLEPSPSSTAVTPPAAGMSRDALEFVPIKPLIPESTFNAQLGQLGRPIEDAEPSNIWGATPELTESVPSESDRSPCASDLPELVRETSPLRPLVQEPGSEESDALDELQGLEIGLDLLDELEGEDEEAMEDGVETTGSGEVSIPVAIDAVWDDLRADYVRIYGKAPCEPPNFIKYLEKLRPTKKGTLECPSCRWSCDGEFCPSHIQHHFRYCHVGNISHADKGHLKPRVWKALDHLMRDPESREIVETLRARCSDIQQNRQQLRNAAQKPHLPSVIVFLTQLRTFCNGQLTCIGPKCKGAHFFSASWGDLRSHYESYHADYLLQDENFRGKLDVLSHLADHNMSIERLFGKARRRRDSWVSMDNDAREMEEARCRWSLECESSAYRRLPKMPQLGVLRDVTKVLRSRYRRFQRLAAESLSADLTSFAEDLKEKYPKPKELRRLGTRIFKQVIQGTSPTTLIEIFAFISLSQAMATVMRRRGIPVASDPGTIDYLAWRTCLNDELDRGLYDKILVAWFHPKWRQELTVSGIDPSSPVHETNQIPPRPWLPPSPLLMEVNQTALDSWTNQIPSWAPILLKSEIIPTAPSAQEAMKKLVLQLMKAKQTNGAFNFSAFLRFDPFTKRQANQGWTCTWWDEDRGFAGPTVDTKPNEEEEDDSGDNGTETLINTAIFIGVYLFMIFIGGLGVALSYLSNSEQRCHIQSAAGEEHVASAYDVMLAIETLKDRILNRLRQGPKIPALENIVTAAEEVLDGGYIWSVSDFHIHLQKAVQNQIEEPCLRSLLDTEITNLCREAFNSIRSICENHGGECMFVVVPGWSPSCFPSPIGL
ncbi:hypothetical protein NCS56_01374100 [Fusarium sp. Ph1]|nr:hypothetical protein NCS56_01374100 [Fusarium sp. Ph1]